MSPTFSYKIKKIKFKLKVNIAYEIARFHKKRKMFENLVNKLQEDI